MIRQDEHPGDLAGYLNILRRRKWMVLQAVVLVPAAAIGFSLSQTRLYEATAEVLLSRQNLATQLTGTPDATLNLQADRVAQTQAGLARVPDVARRVLRKTGVRMTAAEFLESSSVSPQQNADLVEFRVTHRVPRIARQLATAYAQQFTEYRRELDTRALTRARIDVEETLAELAQAGDSRSTLYRSLLEKQQQLETLEALQSSNAFPVRDAEQSEQVQPRPVRNAILGLGLGLVLGLGLAFLWEALDTRVRSAEEIAARLGLPLLARIPQPGRRLQRENRLVMLEDTTGAEPFRMLRTNLEFARLDREIKTIIVTSAVEREGKSTTVANLAVALARAGQRVVLVDLDLRRPYLDRFFDVGGRPGVTQVALGAASLEEALAPIAVNGFDSRGGGTSVEGYGSQNGHAASRPGSLRVLAAGPIPPDPGEFVGTHRLGSILRDLRDDADVVLIDSPPLLRVGDAMTLSARVDALVVVARMNVVRRHMLRELNRLLETAPAAKLGFVLTGAGGGEAYGYGYGYGYGYTAREQRERVTESA
ncbi:MAG: Wzz/FepE/Etk N-terminal domain-containing protein [Gaiellaceae bacterium MAG52_C11]|nr:Wzz/FepE/Etk N-terminal domain-containing protein [Candidatus Gaiellasilicea maunaloa]